MGNKRQSAARREIIHAYEIVRQTGGDGTMVQRVAQFLGRPLSQANGSNSWVAQVIREYRQTMRS